MSKTQTQIDVPEPNISQRERNLDGWREVKLGEVASFYQGLAINSKTKHLIVKSDGLPLLRINDLFENKAEFHISKESAPKQCIATKSDLIFTRTGQVGFVFMGKEGVVHNNCFRIVPKNRNVLFLPFLKYYFEKKGLRDYLVSISSGSVQPDMTHSIIKTLELILPPLPEQKAIAEVLSSLDDKIYLLHRQNKTLEEMAQALFRKWFVEETDKDTTGKFSDWIKDTLGGEWGKENLTDDFNVPVYCIRGTDIAGLNNGLPVKTPVRYIKQKKLQNIEPEEGDIIIEISGGTEKQSTGRSTYINRQIKNLFNHPVVFSNFCRLLKIQREEYSYFVYLYLQYLYFIDEFFGLENGSSGIKNLNYKALLYDLNYQMPRPEKVLTFHEQVKVLFEQINQNKTQIRTLENLRVTLLPKLMRGEVRVGLN